MCGIAGFFRSDDDIKLEVMKNLEIRGRDGFGYTISPTPENWTPLKTLKTASDFFNQDISTGQTAPWRHANIVLANTRAIPTTEFQSGAGQTFENQQPFQSDRFIWVFNGLISNDKELINKYRLQPEASVDTAMLGPLFERVGVVEGMKMLEGAYAIICFDRHNDKLYFGKNFLPLVYHMTEQTIFAASLKEMVPKDLQDQMIELAPYSCLEYDITTFKHTIHSLYRKKRNKKAMIIFSSGIDSVVTAWLYKYLGYELSLVHFTYGQAAMEVEKVAAMHLAMVLGAKCVVYDAKPMFKPFAETSRLLRQNTTDSDVQMADAEGTLSYVPNRNGIFAMFVAALAEKEGCDTVAYGGQQMSASYPDNNIGFVNAIDQTLKYSLNWHTNIKFTAPFIHLIKHEIVKLGLALNVPYDMVCSCYYPKMTEDNKIIVCGKCGCCQFRFSSFKMLGIKDTQQYETLPTPNWFEGLADKLVWDKKDVDDFIEKYIKHYV